MLKVEQELARVTGELERLKGRKRLMKNKVAFATLIIRFNSPVPQRQLVSKGSGALGAVSRQRRLGE